MAAKTKDKRSTRKDAKLKPWVPRVTVAAVLVAAVLAVGSYFQMHDIERGLLAVAAEQQDEYVQMVVEQINLQQDSTDDDTIDNILGVLDTDASRYWAFSRDGSVLYVKDVTETNSYKGMPSISYFEDDAAQAFYGGLSSDTVSHDYISVQGKDYIASGRAFEHAGSTYKLILLTNESVVLDNNQMLGARSRLGALLGIEAALLLFTAVWLAVCRDRAAREASQSQAEAHELRTTVAKLNERIARGRTIDMKTHLWRQDVAEQFESSLRKRGRSAWVAHVTFSERAQRIWFIDRLNIAFGEEVPRFEGDGEADLYVLFLSADRDQAEGLLADALGSAVVRVEWHVMGDAEDNRENGEGEVS